MIKAAIVATAVERLNLPHSRPYYVTPDRLSRVGIAPLPMLDLFFVTRRGGLDGATFIG